MIINPDSIKSQKLTCGRIVGEWLSKEGKLPVLGFGKNGEYIFIINESLRKALRRSPIHIKISLWFEGQNDELTKDIWRSDL
jgi:hypothetical protein